MRHRAAALLEWVVALDLIGRDGESLTAIALIVVAVALPLVASLWLRDTLRKLRASGRSWLKEPNDAAS
jgi:hypothetical protein